MKVYVAVLTIGSIRKELALALLKLMKDSRYKVDLFFHSKRPSETNRNNIVKEFLKSDCDYLLKIDHDTVPLKNPLDLVELGKDVIGCPYPQKVKAGITWLVGMEDKKKEGHFKTYSNGKGLQKVDVVADGCMLIHKRVLERVKEPFMRKWEDGVDVLGSDFYFCEKVRKAGFKVYTHWKYPCSHFKEVDLLWAMSLGANG